MAADPDEIGPYGYMFRIICDAEAGPWMIARERAYLVDRPTIGPCGRSNLWRFEHLFQWMMHRQRCHQPIVPEAGFELLAVDVAWTMFCVQWTMLFSAVLYGRE